MGKNKKIWKLRAAYNDAIAMRNRAIRIAAERWPDAPLEKAEIVWATTSEVVVPVLGRSLEALTLRPSVFGASRLWGRLHLDYNREHNILCIRIPASLPKDTEDEE